MGREIIFRYPLRFFGSDCSCLPKNICSIGDFFTKAELDAPVYLGSYIFYKNVLRAKMMHLLRHLRLHPARCLVCRLVNG